MAGLLRLQFRKWFMYRPAKQVTFRGGLGRQSARKRDAVRRLKRVGPLGMAFIDDTDRDSSFRTYGVSPSEPIVSGGGVTVSPALLQAPSDGASVSPAISNYTDQIVNVRIAPPAAATPVMMRPMMATGIDAPNSATNPMQGTLDDSVQRMYPLLRTDQTGPLASGMPAQTTGNYISAPGVGTRQQSTDSDGNPLPQAQAAAAAAPSSSWQWLVLAAAVLLVMKA